MTDIAAVEDAYLRGTQRFRKWLEKRDFYKPLAESMTKAIGNLTAEAVQQLPPEVIEELERLVPGALDELIGPNSPELGLRNGG